MANTTKTASTLKPVTVIIVLALAAFAAYKGGLQAPAPNSSPASGSNVTHNTNVTLPSATTVALPDAHASSQHQTTQPPAAPAKNSAPAQTPKNEGTDKLTSESVPANGASGVGGSVGSLVTIGSLNIEWLGKPEDRSGQAKGIAQDPKDLADVIIASKADVMALQEIVTQLAGSPKRSREVEAMLAAITLRTKEKWDYVLFPGRRDGDQLTGLMWNTTKVNAVRADGKPWVQTTDLPWQLPIASGRSRQGNSLWNRPPHAMKFTTGKGLSDFVIIVVHMKADYEGDFAQHRAEEAAALVAALPKVTSTMKDQDIIIIGDTNCVQAVEPGAEAIVASGFTDLNTGKLQTHWRGGTMDRAFVPVKQPEFATSRMSVVSDDYLRSKRWRPEDFKKNISDHYPVVFSLTLAKDDD